MRILLITLTVLLFSCHSQRGTKINSSQQGAQSDSLPAGVQKHSIITPAKVPANFLDSIAGKYQLAIDQIRNHRAISEWYYSDSFHAPPTFTGDTVLSIGDDFSTVIITYSGPVCLNKILVVMRSADGQGTDWKEVNTGCDHEEGRGYNETDYVILNDSVFETIETYTAANEIAAEETTITRWKIGGNGKIGSIPQKDYTYLPGSFTSRLRVFKSIVKNFKTKNADEIIRQCHFPFEPLPGMNAGEMIVTPELFREKLQQRFREKWFDEMMVGKPYFNFAENTISYLTRTYNKAGELESESNIIFRFKNEKDGSLQLYDILIAG